MMPSTAKSEKYITTKEALEQEFHANGWEERLARCQQERVDKDFEYASNTRPYRRQELVRHYEGDVLIAFTVEYTMHDGRRIRQLKMLLINGIRHLVP